MGYRLDVFAIFIFLGIIQAIFLCFFFFSAQNRKLQANLFHGIALIAMTACNVEIFLMYSGYIVNCFYLVDFSEPIAFIIGPAFYLMVYSMIHGKVRPKQYLHFIWAGIYFILLIPFFLQPEVVKYNAWIYSYHPELPYRMVAVSGDNRNLITSHATQLILVHLVFYGVLTSIEGVKAFRKEKESFWKPTHAVQKKLQIGVFIMISTVLLLVAIKIFNYHDTGDHMVAAYITFSIYLTSFSVMHSSGFFKQATLQEAPKKYKGSSLTPGLHEGTLQKLKDIMINEKLFRNADFSLPDLAQRLGVSVHALSQVINEGLGKSFFEMAAEYRVEEAKRLLKEQQHVKIEEIAEQVGYLSKSSFNTAFKKLTGMTPSEYRSR